MIRLAKSRMTALFVAALTLCSAAQLAAQVSVSVMPSNSQNRGKYGIAIKGQEITVWGRAWGGSGAYQYKWTVDGVQDVAWHAPGDGFDNHPYFNENADFIPRLHTFPGKGPKVVTLTVKESGADDTTAVSRSAEIDVRDAGEHEDEVSMAIEKALLFLYNSAIDSGVGRVRWESASHLASASTPGGVLAFAENGHLPGNDRVTDIYSELVQEAVNYIVEGGSGYLQKTSVSGVNDHNGNGIGAYTSWAPVYASGWTALAVTFAYPTKETAEAAIIGSGLHQGSSIYEFVGDILDQFYVARRADGAWVYSMTGDGGRLDGSAQQWVALAQRIAIDRWGYPVKQELMDLSVLGFVNTQWADGGCSYHGVPGSWTNAGMTGGSLVGFSLGNKLVANGDDNATRAYNYIGQNFYRKHTSNNTNFETFLGDNGDFYTMFGVKKGLAIQEVETIDTPEGGVVDWQREVDDWLLGKTQHTRFANAKSSGNAFGQHPNGTWTGTVHNGNYGNDFETQHGILLLNRGVTKALPVAEIVVASDTFAVGALFVVDGSSSYHADPVNNSIVEYNWEFAIGSETGTASGIAPVVPAALVDEVGVLTVTLTVVDNVGSTDTTETLINIVDPATTPVPPIAIAIPAAQAPNYEGRPFDDIILDGSESYDPNPGDTITEWLWDLNGDGVYGDAADDALTGQPGLGSSHGETIVVTFDEPKTLTVGLKVITGADGLFGTSVADVLLVFTESDLSVPALSAVYDAGLNEAEVTAIVALAVDPDAAPTVDTRIRFFYGANAVSVELPGFAQGQQNVSVTIADVLPLGETSIQILAVVDPDGQVNEYDEDNNTNETSVSANQAPTITCPGDATIECSGPITLAVTGSDSDGDPLTYQWTVNGVVDVSSTSDTLVINGVLGQTYNVSVSVSDGKESASCGFSVSVVDTQDPTITTPLDITANNDLGVCGAVVIYTAPVGIDNCSGATTEQTAGLASGATFPIGTTVNTFVVTDGAGNTATSSFSVTVVDAEAPQIASVENITVNNDLGVCEAVVTYTAPAGIDNCPGATTVQTAGLASGATFPIGTTVNTFVVTDGAGNTATSSFSVTVVDAEAPQIASVENITVNNDLGVCEAVVTYTAPAGIDNCPGATTVQTAGLASGATFPIGTTVNTFVVTDAAGNTATSSFSVTVNDTEAPVITCPANIVVGNDLGVCGAIVKYITPIGTDNCPGAVTVRTGGLESGKLFPVGTTTVTHTVTDASGNTAECSFTVTVKDSEAPTVVSSPDDEVIECPEEPAFGTPVFADNCDTDLSVVVEDESLLVSGQEVIKIKRTWTATDDAGNSVSSSQTITVEDTTAPVLSGLPAAEITVECDAVPAPADVTAMDACEGPTAVVFDEVKTDGDCVGHYTLTRTWTTTDAVGNTSSAVQVITVQDTTAPVIVSDAHDIVPPDAPITFTVTATDNCDVALSLDYTCHKVNPNGKITDKMDSCVVSLEQVDAGTFNVTIVDSGGVNDIITLFAVATDGCNTSAKEIVINVQNPSNSNANEGVGNGVDGNTPGHDNNGGNDDPGNTPGNPGAKGKKK